MALLLRKNVLELKGTTTSVLVPESTVPVETGGAITKLGEATPLLLVLLVTLELSGASGLVTFQVRVVVQLLALSAMVQLGPDRVPDIGPVLEAVPVPLFVPPLIPLQTQVVLLPDAGKAVLVELPAAH